MPSPIAQEKLAARARRIRLIRQRVIASTLAAFILAWGVVAFDGSKGTTTTVASTTSATTTDTSGSATSSDTTSSPDTSASTDTGATMTTSQS
ncbi:hypothetical protein OM076_29790 [Solirubrobacter ginsenosidimutans]|uniref:Uncharacterized protein n=1 Tax=Solirubrobacter ginsenosidimutans TaxID=490573 RepID=A0A9X3MXE1_9ACTN|nr:hypothetical protein [Solirubrobacter ginsenosidimutans]MDA0164500.1 hypothetical protein [Solirubrobacter ginsenosidimutans]